MRRGIDVLSETVGGGDPVERHRKGLGHLPHRGGAVTQPREDRPAGRIRERGKSAIEGLNIINHMVE